MSEYPEHDKLQKVKDKSQAIGEFLEKMDEQGLILCKQHTHDWSCYEDVVMDGDRVVSHGHLCCSHRNGDRVCDYVTIEHRLEAYFGIDGNKLEAEKRQMLEELRSQHNKPLKPIHCAICGEYLGDGRSNEGPGDKVRVCGKCYISSYLP